MAASTTTSMDHNQVFAVINNIPLFYHSSDLRNYFSQFIETKGFQCFHFRHRPEKKLSENGPSAETSKNVSVSDKGNSGKTSCCVIKLTSGRLRELIKMYHRKHWLDKKGDSIPMLCYISKIRTSSNTPDVNKDDIETVAETSNYKTRAEQKCIPENRETFSASDLTKLAELHPPDIMPNGNVGTPTMFFLDLIKQCRLPPVVIKKLGLTFPKMRSNKKYGNVPYNYGGPAEDTITQEEDGGLIITDGETSAQEEEVDVTSRQGHRIMSADDVEHHNEDPVNCDPTQENQASSHTGVELGNIQKMKSKVTLDTGTKVFKNWRKDKVTRERMKLNIEEKMIGNSKEESEEDNDSCEEWERHEAMYDDVTNQGRNTERLFEDEIELKWEKGGSGLVFYTDAQYWQQQEGDFDEQTADDWDVDMSVYYEEGAGDKDARDYVTMRQENRRRDGIEATDRFTAGISKKNPQKHSWQPNKEPTIGLFEKHTKGFGSKILKKQGWKDGEGLGSTVEGISEALEGEGQAPKDKSGFGFRGEKLVFNVSNKRKRRADRDVIISTVYDNPKETDPVEPLHRRNEPHHITYRESIHFKKGKSD